jgi:hypothetical protein
MVNLEVRQQLKGSKPKLDTQVEWLNFDAFVLRSAEDAHAFVGPKNCIVVLCSCPCNGSSELLSTYTRLRVTNRLLDLMVDYSKTYLAHFLRGGDATLMPF